MRLVLAVAAGLAAGAASAKDCAPKERATAPRQRCASAPPERLRPFDPRESKPREPGVVDLGNGTTVRMRGSVRMDLDHRR